MPMDYEGYPILNKDVVAPLGYFKRQLRQSVPLKFHSEVEDLAEAENAPNKDSKKIAKNASGKSDEGGYYKTYGSDAEGEKGYLKETYSKGDHGYKTFDTFHKQDGDKYGFEKHFAYGKARSAKDSDKHAEQSSNIGKHEDHEGAGTIVDSHYVDNKGDHSGEQYSGDYSSHYTAAEPSSESYSDTGDGHNRNYSTGSGSEGSYENHSSYSSSSDSAGDYGDHY
ncbi:PREDICTED: stress protein DDR48-like [Polistes dominula]|uniref:Stress protein DDR48-like n=1 Tax=Polistes dominula TaxID=743375 RepID=A0ABM1IN04_POLDO|nr:PREDICTED: stress protein DDR48-like [Polistes dominula]